ncbi:hypothetical protein BFG60_1092 [Microcystis aeruginosa NIES-98]|nr:hypothetical protein BFG60_1092 [Microcystis aeruginosa NIES-98]
MKIGKTLHPTPHTPHPVPTNNFLPQTLNSLKAKSSENNRQFPGELKEN